METKHMKSTLKFLSASALLALASSAILTGCPSSTEDPCVLNDDCETGYICNTDTETCVLDGTECTGNADCTVDGEACISSPDNDGTSICGMPASCGDIAVEAERNSYCAGANPGDECLPAASGDADVVECRAPANCGEATDPDAFCRNELGIVADSGATCNTAGETPTCELTTVTEHYYILIKDETVQDCEDSQPNDTEPDSGSDITFVEVKGADAATVGWGRTVTYTQGNGANLFTMADVLDGNPPDLITSGEQEDIDNRCPQGKSADGGNRFANDRVLSLGCTGSVLVDFPASNGTDLQPIYNGYTVEVGEYATVCNQDLKPDSTMGTDKYDVYVCPPVEAGMSSDLDCLTDGVKISEGQSDGGYKELNVTGTKDAPASDA